VDVTPPLEQVGDPFSSSYRAEWDHFLRVVRGAEPAPLLDEQLQLQRTMEAIQLSAAEGREIAL
jgi:predicted dehydrogenase